MTISGRTHLLRIVATLPVCYGSLVVPTLAQDGIPRAVPAEVVPVGSFERPPILKAEAILQPYYVRGHYHAVDPEVPTYAGRNSYTIRSSFGIFYADGNYELTQRIGEIEAIVRLQEVSKSDSYIKALEEAAKSPLYLARDLAEHPVKTVVGVPQGIFKFIGRTGRSVGEKIRGKEQNEYEDSNLKAAIGFSKAKRDLAAQLGINPYTTNEVLQKELNGVAWAAFAGKMTFTAALAPVGGTAGQVVTGINISTSASDAVRDLSPQDLRQRHKETLQKMGLRDEDINAFLDHPSYSPVYQAELVAAVQELFQASGRAAFISAAAGALGEADAIFYSRSARLMAEINRQKPITAIYVVDGLPVCQQADGVIVVPLEWDYACWTEGAEIFSEHLKELLLGGKPPTGLHLIITGIASPRMKQELVDRHILLTEKALSGPLL